jgi:hypothetical protein
MHDDNENVVSFSAAKQARIDELARLRAELTESGDDAFGQHPTKRSIPVEADAALAAEIQSHGGVGLEHVVSLHDLYLAYHYESRKQDLFAFQTSDQHIRDFIDRLLEFALQMLQGEFVTVVGIILGLIQEMIEAHPELRKQVLGPPLFHSRSSAEVGAEMAAVSKTLARLQEEHDAALRREREENIA